MPTRVIVELLPSRVDRRMLQILQIADDSPAAIEIVALWSAIALHELRTYGTEALQVPRMH